MLLQLVIIVGSLVPTSFSSNTTAETTAATITDTTEADGGSGLSVGEIVIIAIAIAILLIIMAAVPVFIAAKRRANSAASSETRMQTANQEGFEGGDNNDDPNLQNMAYDEIQDKDQYDEIKEPSDNVEIRESGATATRYKKSELNEIQTSTRVVEKPESPEDAYVDDEVLAHSSAYAVIQDNDEYLELRDPNTPIHQTESGYEVPIRRNLDTSG